MRWQRIHEFCVQGTRLHNRAICDIYPYTFGASLSSSLPASIFRVHWTYEYTVNRFRKSARGYLPLSVTGIRFNG